jgi:SAM-dependent methyltransferase
MAYDPTMYLGAAAHYRHGRPPYSPQLEGFLAGELGLDGTGRLLDVGCGPGILTVRLAPLFADAVGLDPDPDMLDEGRRAADKLDLDIRWVQARAEDLPDPALGPHRLVTFGQSFHWTEERAVAETVYDMLEPDGAMALIVHTVDGRSKPPPAGTPIPHAELEALVERYVGRARAGQGTRTSHLRTERFEDVLADTRFGRPTSVFLPGVPDLLRDIDSVVSGYFSFSWAAPHLFGDRQDAFAAEARELLASRSPDGVFWDWPGDTEVILARKPA